MTFSPVSATMDPASEPRARWWREGTGRGHAGHDGPRRVGRKDAAGLLQETFARVLRHGHIESAANPPALRQQVAVNLVRDFARRRKTEAAHFEFGDLPEDAPSSEVPAEEQIAHRQRLRSLRATAEMLPLRCREVFVMAAFEDVPLDEIAKRLDISRNMVEKHMRFALHRCRALGRYHHGHVYFVDSDLRARRVNGVFGTDDPVAAIGEVETSLGLHATYLTRYLIFLHQ